MLHVDIGIMVYNEEKNIIKLLESISRQKLKNIVIDNIEVISSGSTDKTNEMVYDYSSKNKKVCLFIQEEREGKPFAINEFLKNSENEIVIVSSGDVVFDDETTGRLIEPFTKHEKIGMSSVKPIPINGNVKSLMGFIVKMHWQFHNLLERNGEVIAFKKSIVREIPIEIVADEAYIEALTQMKRMRTVHVKEAVVYNKGPEIPIEFIRQIRRHFFGHIQLKKMLGYSVSSLKTRGIANVLLRLTRFSINNPSKTHYGLVYVFLELCGRILGIFDFVTKKANHLWKMSDSTKNIGESIIINARARALQELKLARDDFT